MYNHSNHSTYFRRWDNFVWDYAGNEMIRQSIFLIAGACAGFPALLWALSVLYRHRKSGGRVYFIAILLLFSDLLELILNPVLLICIFKEGEMYAFKCIRFEQMLCGARLCGHVLHQLVALENILRKKYLAFIFSTWSSIILCIFVFVVIFAIQFIPGPIISQINICLCVFPAILCLVTCTVTCKASPDTSQDTDRKPGVLVLSVAMFTLIILYMPFFLISYFEAPDMLTAVVSMRLISEPLLCVLVCRENC